MLTGYVQKALRSLLSTYGRLSVVQGTYGRPFVPYCQLIRSISYCLLYGELFVYLIYILSHLFNPFYSPAGNASDDTTDNERRVWLTNRTEEEGRGEEQKKEGDDTIMPSAEDQKKEIADAIAELRSIPQLEAEREKVTELINEAEEQLYKKLEENIRLAEMVFGPAYGESCSHHSRHCLTLSYTQAGKNITKQKRNISRKGHKQTGKKASTPRRPASMILRRRNEKIQIDLMRQVNRC